MKTLALPKNRGKADGQDKASGGITRSLRGCALDLCIGRWRTSSARADFTAGLGFEAMQRFGESAEFLAAGGWHPHLAELRWVAACRGDYRARSHGDGVCD